MKTGTFSLKYDIATNKSADALIGLAFFALATLLGSFVRIPVPGTPVPITLQTFFAILSGACLGRRLGALSQLGFIALWSGLGISQLWGPTGGYLLGLMAGAYVVGWMTEGRAFDFLRTISSFAIGILVIYSFGISQLIFLYRVAPRHAFLIGILPFIVGDTIKASLAAAVYSAMCGRSGGIFSGRGKPS